ncbi:hypothetical protein HK100_001749 [Physocladia obscura]|uniref:2Fe-2S ferredoxin-type domain-containing protein n=1 Tax=Physocladia obscura TaxID=109957 RepID=A0AAD5XJM7_9FUNG|nr:hypothetical protein HK100_001749 [Physocladia obscura]
MLLESTRIAISATRVIYSAISIGEINLHSRILRCNIRAVPFSSECCTPINQKTNQAEKQTQSQLRPIELSKFNYIQHLLVLSPAHSIQSEWPKKIEADPYISKLNEATAILSNLKITASTTISSSPPPSPSAIAPLQFQSQSESARDILVFPDMLHFKNVCPQSFDVLVKHLVESRLGVFNASTASSDIAVDTCTGTHHLLVCTHASRDVRCGALGYRLISALADVLGPRKDVVVHESSHVGGHAWAANLIAYPRGDWYGNLAQSGETAVPDARALVDAVDTGVVFWEKWRGRIGLDEAVMKRMVAAKKELDKDAKEAGSCCSGDISAEPASGRKTDHVGVAEKKQQTIKVTYVLQNGQRIVVDAELSEFTPADPENPYFPSTAADTRVPITATTANTPLTITPNIHEKEVSALLSKEADEIELTFVLGNGPKAERRLVRPKIGQSLLDVAKDANIPTIEGVCGGNMECATCHVIVHDNHFTRLPPPSEGEEDMLEYAIGRKDCSRLACQLKVSKEMDGMEFRIHIPASGEIFV